MERGSNGIGCDVDEMRCDVNGMGWDMDGTGWDWIRAQEWRRHFVLEP